MVQADHLHRLRIPEAEGRVQRRVRKREELAFWTTIAETKTTLPLGDNPVSVYVAEIDKVPLGDDPDSVYLAEIEKTLPL